MQSVNCWGPLNRCCPCCDDVWDRDTVCYGGCVCCAGPRSDVLPRAGNRDHSLCRTVVIRLVDGMFPATRFLLASSYVLFWTLEGCFCDMTPTRLLLFCCAACLCGTCGATTHQPLAFTVFVPPVLQCLQLQSNRHGLTQFRTACTAVLFACTIWCGTFL
jgi:hypothetical protein